MLRVSSGFQTLENNKSTRPAALCFHQISCVSNPDETLALVFEILHKRGYSYSERTTLFQSTITPSKSKIIPVILTLSHFASSVVTTIITEAFSTFIK